MADLLEVLERVSRKVESAMCVLQDLKDYVLNTMGESNLQTLPYIEAENNDFKVGLIVGSEECVLSVRVMLKWFSISSKDPEYSRCVQKLLTNPKETLVIAKNYDVLENLIFQAMLNYANQFEED